MFTGLVEEQGRIVRAVPAPDDMGRELTIASSFSGELAIGESVAINGVCLTVTERTATAFAVHCTATTLELTTLGRVGAGHPVNLERSVTPATRLGGHWVLGHVDTTGTIAAIAPLGDAMSVRIAFPHRFHPLVVPLGSVTVDGVSLTVVTVDTDALSVTVIPHTQKATTLGHLTPGQAVNLEFDALGKYVQQLLAPYMARGPLPQWNTQEGDFR